MDEELPTLHRHKEKGKLSNGSIRELETLRFKIAELEFEEEAIGKALAGLKAERPAFFIIDVELENSSHRCLVLQELKQMIKERYALLLQGLGKSKR